MSIETLPLKANGHLLLPVGKDEVEVFKPLDDDVAPFVTGTWFRCAVCNGWPTFRITEDAVHVQDPCPYPDGFTTTITLQVPSGRLLVTDDLRPVYDYDDTRLASLNSALGKTQAVKAMAEIGAAFGSTRNCGLGLYPTGDGTYVIATPAYSEDEVHPTFPESACLADIVTDLWAYSMVDFESWQKRGGDPSTLDWCDTVVDVPAGTYKVTYHGAERSFEPESADDVIWAHIERIP
ncbi:hypothetical protein ETD86_45845 [Nonomuraea turkmeniaca]|uniref:DUF4241 domain-containing protein n=1 Tax=Nonomuraea turkmeniaca TaxID=103838 RepID=A0A5S4EZ84_9ACTN|nr:hypothetical protein [Nonomuraea turkmeniaca]TMR08899.1 hypothetical protein ETD86_45845 [Nonomuraea turkmeniaca]